MSPENGGERSTPAERAVRRRVAALEEAAQSDVRALMEAGLALMIAGDGRRGPRVADIVAAAGLSNDSFYRYFAGKDALVEAIVDQGARTVVGYVRHRIAAVRDPAEQLRVGVAAIMKQVSDADLATKTRAVLGNSTRMAQGSPHVSVMLVDALAELFAAPAAGLGADEPEQVARTIAGTVFAAMQYYLFKEQVPGEDELERLTAFLLAGVRASAGSPPR
ncbi:DNA-binding transcriptional regulator, AcrR family [Thermomonospora echinospora]|uniref:DNA-binding transcriptional regulator, AcrR family n=1 Tax=Thermomonospora echinospora TaxID=1992 RepID=A0A1H6DIS3_9ACTN|nr:TetR/AcrR family transcriptional regulator [Thermomonospora echinospora]SEG85089.1 DNA-binding transcriptional regulator, AcrR family [Thermomonospora echinospora]